MAEFFAQGNPQNIPKVKGGDNMFFAASEEQVRQLHPELIDYESEKSRCFYHYEDGSIRWFDRIYGWYFSDKEWGLETEYKVEGITQQWLPDYTSLNIRNSTIKAPDGWTEVSCDYSAEEIRLAAINTHGKTYLEAFREGKDVHLMTAIAMFGEEKVNENRKKYRSKAKGCNAVDAYYATESGYKHLQDTDHVLDMNGNRQEFHYVVEHNKGHKIYLSNGQILTVTNNHKFFDLDVGEFKEHYLGMKIPLLKLDNKKFNTNDKFTFSYDSWVHNKKGDKTITKTKEFTLNRDLGYLIGYYLGDGTINGVCLSLCCHPSNKDYLLSVLESLKSTRKGIKGPTIRKETDKYCIINNTNTMLVKFIDKFFGHSKCKHINLDFCYSAPLEFNLGLVSGFLDADGSHYSTSSLHLVNVLETLSRGFAELLAFVGIPVRWEESTYIYKGESRPLYDLIILDTTHLDLKVESKANRIRHSILPKYFENEDLSKGFPITITKIEDVEADFNIMECDTHYYEAMNLHQPNCNFGLGYGGSAKVLERIAGMSPEDAKEAYDAFMDGMSDHFMVQAKQVHTTHQTMCEHSLFGFPVRLHRYYRSNSFKDVSAGERLAKNHRIQATGADILSLAFMKIWKNIYQQLEHPEDYIRFNLTVHDEIDFYIKNEAIPILVPKIIENMIVQMPDWPIPVIVGLSMGPSLGQLYEWEYDTKENGYRVLTPALEEVKKKEPEVKVEKKPEVEEEITLEF